MEQRDLTVAVVVQAMPERPALRTTLRSLIESDVPWPPEVLYQPRTRKPEEFFVEVLDWMSAQKTDLVLRLEDDVLVNRHLLHNIVTWPALHDPRFGMGWLFDPGWSCRTVHDVMYQRTPGDRWHGGTLHGALGVLCWTRDMPAIRDRAAAYVAEHGIVFDIALTGACAAEGKYLCVHSPCLVEHQCEPSTLGHVTHPEHDTSNGSFSADWRRAAD